MQIARPLRHRRAVYAAAARELPLWLLQVMALVAARPRLPRILRLDSQDEIRKARRDIRMLIFLGMCARMTFRRDRPKLTRGPNGIAGYQRRRGGLLRIYARGIPLRTRLRTGKCAVRHGYRRYHLHYLRPGHAPESRRKHERPRSLPRLKIAMRLRSIFEFVARRWRDSHDPLRDHVEEIVGRFL